MNKIRIWFVILSFSLIATSCFRDIIEYDEVVVNYENIASLSRNLDLSKFPVIKDTIDFPIIAWFGIHNKHINLNRFQELKDAGFTINYFPYVNSDSLHNALDLSHKVGIKTLISTNDFFVNPEPIVERFKDHPANAGYFIKDEPSVLLIPQLSTFIKRIKSVDPLGFCYVNLLPNFAPTSVMGTHSYKDYVNQYITELELDVISFDYYPIVGNPSMIKYGWYNNLELIREKGKLFNKPFWTFALATSHGDYPIPTLEQLRLQTFSNLAYGAKGIQYYTYWTIDSPNYEYTLGPIDKNGSKTLTYDLIRQVNNEIQTLSFIFLSSEVVKISHYGKSVIDGISRFDSLPIFVKSLKFNGNSAVISEMKNDNNTFLLIQNNDLHNPLGVTIVTDLETRIILKNGKIIPASLFNGEFRIDSGDMVIFIR